MKVQGHEHAGSIGMFRQLLITAAPGSVGKLATHFNPGRCVSLWRWCKHRVPKFKWCAPKVDVVVVVNRNLDCRIVKIKGIISNVLYISQLVVAEGKAF